MSTLIIGVLPCLSPLHFTLAFVLSISPLFVYITDYSLNIIGLNVFSSSTPFSSHQSPIVCTKITLICAPLPGNSVKFKTTLNKTHCDLGISDVKFTAKLCGWAPRVLFYLSTMKLETSHLPLVRYLPQTQRGLLFCLFII